MRKVGIGLVAVVSFILSWSAVSAAPKAAPVASWPAKTVEILVPAAPGGGMSITAGIFQKYFEQETGKNIVMVNNAGLPGYQASLKLGPTGYNFFLSNATLFTYKSLGTLEKGYDAYEAVGIIGIAPAFSVFVMADSKYKTFKDLVTDMAARPGKVVIGNKAGTYKHLFAALMLDTVGAKANLVEYGDDAACLVAMLGGNCDVFLGSYSGAVQQYVDSGKVVCLAVADTARVSYTPNSPTFIELGYDFTFPYQMTTLVAPKGTDPAVLDKMNSIISRLSVSPGYQAEMKKLGSITVAWDREKTSKYFVECQVKMDKASNLIK